ncbi:MAG: hypothetical protein LWW94_10295 [Candidatus Desulfofervidaceae bacterium]|nr:hypothetical protein [Candidatus Desulfofervidaceae bacterium]
MMKELANKLLKIEQELAFQKGGFSLFALFLREDAEDNWDLLISAPWVTKNKTNTLKYLAKKLQESLTPQEIVKLSKIVIIEPDNPALEAIHKAIHVEHGLVEVKDSIFFGLPIKHAFIITSQKLNGKTIKKRKV